MTTISVACILAWLLPGGGHLYLRRWQRGAVFLVIVILLFVLGLGMDGKLFSLESGFFGLLRFIANAAVGLPYLIGKLFGFGVGDIRSFGYEYGNTFLYTAGLINMLVILDAFDIAKRRKR